MSIEGSRQHIKASVVQSGIRGKFDLTLKSEREKTLMHKNKKQETGFEETESRFKFNPGVFAFLRSSKNRP